MIEQYLSGSIAQSLERIRQLRQIAHGEYQREYDGLRQVCLVRLDDARRELERLDEELVVDTTLQSPRRVREFKRVVASIGAIESVGIFALTRARPEDDFLNRLITKVCREIRYPLITPVVSQMSQDYFHIFPEFSLLCMPLIEGRFLLHLPDLYHELCHPIHSLENADLPKLEPYHNAYRKSLFVMVEHFSEAIQSAERLRGPDGQIFRIELWTSCWVKYWMEEFFCDLFGVLTAGPAFAWAHYHLCVKRGGDPFETPLVLYETHPADDARMRAMLKTLARMGGFDREVQAIEAAWGNFVSVMGYRPIPEYGECYEDTLLSMIAEAAKEGVEAIGVRIAAAGALAPTVGLLNAAWSRFWKSPQQYQVWESRQLNELRGTVESGMAS
jgi:hypothetical protein